MSAQTTPVVVRPGEHGCCRFASPRDRWTAAVSAVADGLGRGHRVLCIYDSKSDQQLTADLEAHSDAVAAGLRRGDLSAYSAADIYAGGGGFDIDEVLGWWTDERERALQDGYPGLTIAGELGEGFCAVGGTAAVQEYERRVDEGDFPDVRFFCQYDHAHLGSHHTAPLARYHEVDLAPELAPIARTGRLAAARLRDGALRLAGELDVANALMVANLLDTHFPGPRRLDLLDLRVVDVAGMRALRGDAGWPLDIDGVSPAVGQMLELLAWDTDPAVAVHPDR